MQNRFVRAAVSAMAAASVSVGLLSGAVPVLAETSEASSEEESTGETEDGDEDTEDTAEVTTLSIGTFTNTYTPDAASAALEASVTLTTPGGTEIAMTDGEFSFVLQEYTSDSYETTSGDAVSAVSTADGTISFDEIEYTKVGTYYYVIVQIEGSEEQIEYDDMSCRITVTVTAGDEDNLVATVTYPSDTNFDNIYAPEEVTVSLTARKTLRDTASSGRTMAEGEFTFELKDASGTLIETAANDADGYVVFADITFDEAGTYTYYVSETAGTDSHISYDDSVKKVVITVAEDDAAALQATVSVSTVDDEEE